MKEEEIIVLKKKSGPEPFNREKIHSAIRKSADRVLMSMSDGDCRAVSDVVLSKIDKTEVTVKELHKLVEIALDEADYPKVAEMYRQYRNYKEDAVKIMEAVDAKTLELQYKTDRSNANANSALISTKRSIIYQEQQKERYKRICLNPEELEAVNDGYFYIHDLGARLDSFNCFRRDTRFITSIGVKSFYDFSDGDKVTVLTPYGNWKTAVVHKYGWKKLQEVTFNKGPMKKTIYCTKDHSWILNSGTRTTNLSIGDKLWKLPDFTDYNWDSLSLEDKKLWCKGFALGDGSVQKNPTHDMTLIRLCGDKEKYSDRFKDCGYNVVSHNYSDGHYVIAYLLDTASKDIPWLSLNYSNIKYYIDGLLCADGSKNPNGVSKYKGIQVTGSNLNKYIYDLLNIAGYFVTSSRDLTGTSTNYGTRTDTTVFYQISNDSSKIWKVQDIKDSKLNSKAEVWCLEVEDDHAFILEGGIPTGNCNLTNAKRIMKGGFNLQGIDYTEPGSASSAIAVLSDIMSVVAGNQYGGLTIPEVDDVLSDYCAKSYDFYIDQYKEIVENNRSILDKAWRKIRSLFGADLEKEDFKKRDNYAEERVRREISQGIQGIEHSFNSVSSCRGDFPFTTFTLGLKTDRWGQVVTEEILKVRREGQGRPGRKVPVVFPKLVFLYTDELHGPGAPLEHLFNEAIECTKVAQYPDYLSLNSGSYLGDVYHKWGRAISPMGRI